MKRRDLMKVMGAAAAAGVLAGCSSESSESSDSGSSDTSSGGESSDGALTIGVSWKTLQEERWVIELNAIQEICDEMGINMIYQCSENDSQKQVSQIENLISQGIDILICMAPERGQVKNVLKEAHDSGVFVAYYEEIVGETYADFSGGNDYYEVGQLITSGIAEICPSGDVVYLLGDSAGGTGVTEFRRGMYDSMEGADVNVVGEQYVTNWDANTAMGYVENWLTQYKDTLVAVLCMNDGLAGGAIQALSNDGLAGKVLVCGQDCDLAACQRILEGTQYSTVIKGGADYARQFVETMLKYYNGELTYDDFDTYDTNSEGEEIAFMSYPASLVTATNVDELVIDSGIYTHEEVYGE